MDAVEVCGLLDSNLISFIHNVIVIIKIAVPVLLIVFGMLDFGKSVVGNKEEEIKKGLQVFIKRVIAGVCVFFVVTIVQLVMSLVSSDDDSFWNCANQILNGNVNKVTHSTTNDLSKCKSTVEAVRKEYDYCLTKTGNEICNTIFQKDCMETYSNLLWHYNSSGKLSEVVTGYKCESGNGKYENYYKRALYSCSTDDDNQRSLEECASLLSPFCSKY